MKFKTMDPDVAWKLLEGHKDILTPAAEQRTSIYKNITCPSCGSRKMQPQIKPVRDDEVVPYHHFLCKDCGCLYDPRSNLVLNEGKPFLTGD
jgi:hypothetical protein